MILFGIGTLPVMLGLTSIFQHLVTRFNLNLRKVSTAMLFASGCVLIARVVFINHAHISPEEQHVVDIVMCR
jgi:sulfite exporter TauE/SafE